MAKFLDPDEQQGQSGFVDPDAGTPSGRLGPGGRPGSTIDEDALDFERRNRLAFQTGISPVDIDLTTGAKFGERVDYSFSDTDDEIINKFTKKYPKGVMKRTKFPDEPVTRNYHGQEQSYVKPGPTVLLYKTDSEDSKEKWKSIEDYGKLSMGDIADVAGAAPEVIGAIGTSLLFPPSAGWQAAALGLGTLGGHVAKETLEEARGMQLQPWTEVMKTGAIKGGAAAALGYGAHLAMKPVNVGAGRGLLRTSEADRAAALRIKQSGLDLEPLGAHQLASEHPILTGKAAQAFSTSHYGQQAVSKQAASAVKALRGLEPKTAGHLGKKLQNMASREYWKKHWAQTRARFTTPEMGGKNLQQAAKSFSQKSRAEVGKLYDQVDDIATTQNPVFDLSAARSEVQNIKNAILADIPEEQAAVGQVNVANTPKGQLLGVIDDIERISQTQTNYETVKSLRTRLFGLIDNEAWQWDVNKYYASQLWGKLTESIRNPVGGNNAFTNTFNAASAAHRARMDILNMSTFQRVMRAEKPVELANTYARPGAIPDEIHKAFTRFSPKKYDMFKQYAQLKMLRDNGGAMNAINKFMRDDPEGFARLVPKSQRTGLLRTAKNLDYLNSEQAAKLIGKQAEYDTVIETMLSKQTPLSAQRTLKFYGGKGSEGHTYLRRATLKHIINRAVKPSEKGYDVVDRKSLIGIIKEYKDKGVYDFLTSNDKLRLHALDDYVRMAKVDADVGVSLQKQAIIGQFSHPAKWGHAIRSLSVNELVARALMNNKISNLLVGMGRKPLSSIPLQRSSVVINAIAQDMEAGQQGLSKAESRMQKKSVEALDATY